VTLCAGDLVRIRPEVRARLSSRRHRRDTILMWAAPLRGGLTAADPVEDSPGFIRVPWDSVGVALEAEADTGGGSRMVRVLFPAGVAYWWADRFETLGAL
jgi:hypothetical protein